MLYEEKKIIPTFLFCFDSVNMDLIPDLDVHLVVDL